MSTFVEHAIAEAGDQMLLGLVAFLAGIGVYSASRAGKKVAVKAGESVWQHTYGWALNLENQWNAAIQKGWLPGPAAWSPRHNPQRW